MYLSVPKPHWLSLYDVFNYFSKSLGVSGGYEILNNIYPSPINLNFYNRKLTKIGELSRELKINFFLHQ